ncbi:hypothetical protein AB0I81_39980 [Nonomuraea sp. NPDC050404]|uniref:hypothetical protein n=1 Tax=Nonomuraea sp. NPDC050404 TaxID=3155783 RepID=UPI0033D26C67
MLRADPELIDLLIALRGGPHWTPATIRNAITTADNLGQPWTTTMHQLINLAQIDGTKPEQIPAQARQEKP